MANGIDTILQGYSSLNQGLGNLRQGIDSALARSDREEEKRKKEESEKALQTRIIDAMGGVEGLNEAAQDPNFTREDLLNHPAAKTLYTEAAATGNTGLTAPLGPVERLIKKREEDAIRGQESEQEKTKQEKADAKYKKKEKVDKFKMVRELSQDYAKDDLTKRTKVMREAFGKIQASGESATGPGDLSLIFNYMKVLDPQSVVRESEFRSAQNSGAWLESLPKDENGNPLTREGGVPIPAPILRMFQKIDPDQKGAFLLPSQRRQFLKEAGALYGSQIDKQEALENQYRREADILEADHSRVIPNSIEGERESLKKYLESLEEIKEEDDAPKGDVIDPESPSFQEMVAEYEPAFKDAVEQVNEQRAAQGLPPLTEEEKEERFNQVLRKNGIILKGAQ